MQSKNSNNEDIYIAAVVGVICKTKHVHAWQQNADILELDKSETAFNGIHKHWQPYLISSDHESLNV